MMTDRHSEEAAGRWMKEGVGWLDEVGGRGYRWVRRGEGLLEAELRPGLPSRIRLGEADGEPVLYVTVGVNGTLHYWQWATLDDAGRPLPRARALEKMWKFLELTQLVSKSRVEHKLLQP